MDLFLIQQHIVTDIKLSLLFFLFCFYVPLFLCRFRGDDYFAHPEIAFLDQELSPNRCVDLLALTCFAQQILDYFFLVHVVYLNNAEFYGLLCVL